MTESGRTALKLALFAAGLVVVAGVAALVGRASGIEVDDETGSAMAHETEDGQTDAATGLSDVAAGFRLRLSSEPLTAGEPGRVGLTIDRDGEPFTGLDTGHGEPPLHLILVRRDLGGYVHLHPRRSGDGFATDVTLPTPGVWRAYADFEVDGEKRVLGRDLFVPGEVTHRTLPEPRLAAVADGYRIGLERGDALAFSITRGGRPVTALQPYLGAEGHLVAIREDDLAYLHVHPLDGAGPGRIAFDAELSAPGRYALFLQFKHGGRVHTGAFTIVEGG